MLNIFYTPTGGEGFQDQDKLMDLLDSENRLRIQRKAAKGQFQSLAAHGLSLFALKKLGLEGLAVRRNEGGKPLLCGKGEGLYLSCTHTEGLVAVAVSNFPVGVDAEYIRQWNKRVSARMFTQEECAYIAVSENPALAFTQVWTLRESHCKMLGVGIAALAKVKLPVGEGAELISHLADGFVISAIQRGTEPHCREGLHRVGFRQVEKVLAGQGQDGKPGSKLNPKI